MGILSGFAQDDNFTYTDGNGVTWGGYVGYDYETQKTEVSINTTSSNSKEEVVVPGEISYEGEKYKVTKLGRVFSGNKIIEKVTIPKTVTYLDNTFSGCSALSEVINTNQIKYIEYAFYNCSNLTTIPQLDTSNGSNMGQMFYGCSYLTSLNLSSFDTSNVTTMEQMFGNCSRLTNLNISNFDFTNVRSYSGMFSNVPANCLIIVKDDTAKEWITSKFTTLTNVKTVAELGE